MSHSTLKLLLTASFMSRAPLRHMFQVLREKSLIKLLSEIQEAAAEKPPLQFERLCLLDFNEAVILRQGLIYVFSMQAGWTRITLPK